LNPRVHLLALRVARGTKSHINHQAKVAKRARRNEESVSLDRATSNECWTDSTIRWRQQLELRRAANEAPIFVWKAVEERIWRWGLDDRTLGLGLNLSLPHGIRVVELCRVRGERDDQRESEFSEHSTHRNRMTATRQVRNTTEILGRCPHSRG
jgi:hypothetical protein